jgi:S1-C subfamily serine protease
VIGMNTAILRNAQGLGFAIPIDQVQRISKQLVAKGKVEHPFLGVQMMTVTSQLRKQLASDPTSPIKLDVDQGALIGKLVKNSPAAQAGLKVGDVIIAVNGKTVTNGSDVQTEVEKAQLGVEMPLSIRRDGKTIEVKVRPVAMNATTTTTPSEEGGKSEEQP